MDEPQPTDLNDLYKRPAAAPPAPAARPTPAPGYPPIGAAIAQRARPISTPPPFNGPSGDGFAQSIYESERQSARSRNITVGLIMLVIGIIITAVTYDSASSSPSGGTYIVAWGPMVFGAIRLFKGLAG